MAWWYAAVAAALVDLGRQDRVRDEHGRALEVVEDHEVGGENHTELGHAQVVGGQLGQPLEPAHDVVREEADQSPGERWQCRTGRGTAAPGEDPDASRAAR